MMNETAVASLHLYPIKSCAGVTVDSAELLPTGFANDRLLMLTNRSGHFLSQRSEPRMALIQPQLDGDQLTLTAPDFPSLTLTIQRTGEPTPVLVWGDWCYGVDQAQDSAEWFSDFLGLDCRLVAMYEGFRRPVDPSYAISESDITSFSDGYPFLLIGTASLEDLNQRLLEPVGMERFRPNIVVQTDQPYSEDRWLDFLIGDVRFSGVKLCSRCLIPSIDPETAKIGKEPNATLSRYRLFNGKIYFGQNLIHHQLGSIRVGDRVVLLN